MSYFFDSYAIIEIIKGNKAYLCFKDIEVITNTLNIAEVYYALLKEHEKKNVDEIIKKFNFSFVTISKKIAIDAAKFRFKNKSLKISYADSIGYITALKNKLNFLTGDEAFKNLKQTKFIK